MAKKREQPEEEKPFCVTIDGVEHPVAALGMPEIAQLQIWVKSQQPDPIKAIQPYMKDFDDTCKRHMLDNALAELRKPVEIGSTEWVLALASKHGLRELLYLGLRRGGADVTREQSDRAADQLDARGATSMMGAVFHRKASQNGEA